MRATCLVVLSTLVWAASLLGQTVSVTTQDLQGQPLSGAYVVVLDSLDHMVSSGSAGSGGGLTLSLPSAGRYRVVVQMLGFQATQTPLFQVDAGDTRQLRIGLPPNPVELNEVVAAADRDAATPVHTARLERPAIEALLPGASIRSLLQRLRATGLRIREAPVSAGSSTTFLCVEPARARSVLNGSQRAFGSLLGGCAMVSVYVNGSRIPNPESFLGWLDPADVFRMEYLPGVVAGARYGTGSENGVLLISTVPS